MKTFAYGNQCVAIIPARSGSKSVKSKNIIELSGRPLIAYTIEVALESPGIDRVIVSTDSEIIRSIASDYGAEVPFIRPVSLAQDDTPDFPVFMHAMRWLQKHQGFVPNITCWLRPTSPFRSIEDVENSIKLLVESKADAVRSVCLVEHHPYWMYKFDDDYLLPFVEDIDVMGRYYQRQLLPPVYRLNGAVDLMLTKTAIQNNVMFSGKICGQVMPAERSIDIDNHLDFKLAEIVLKERSCKK